MSGFAHAYVHRDSIGDRTACERHLDEAEPLIDRLHAAGRITGYQLLLVGDDLEARDELVLTTRVEPVTGGHFPYVYTRVQPTEGIDVDLDAFMDRLGYTRVDPG